MIEVLLTMKNDGIGWRVKQTQKRQDFKQIGGNVQQNFHQCKIRDLTATAAIAAGRPHQPKHDNMLREY